MNKAVFRVLGKNVLRGDYVWFGKSGLTKISNVSATSRGKLVLEAGLQRMMVRADGEVPVVKSLRDYIDHMMKDAGNALM